LSGRLAGMFRRSAMLENSKGGIHRRNGGRSRLTRPGFIRATRALAKAAQTGQIPDDVPR